MEGVRKTVLYLTVAACGLVIWLIASTDLQGQPGLLWELSTGEEGTDGRTALSLVFLGGAGLVIGAIVFLFLLKFTWNIAYSVVSQGVAEEWRGTVMWLLLLVLLMPCALLRSEIKMKALSVKMQVAGLIDAAKGYDPKVQINSGQIDESLARDVGASAKFSDKESRAEAERVLREAKADAKVEKVDPGKISIKEIISGLKEFTGKDAGKKTENSESGK
ncbi:MAG: hypothetical protein HZA20_06765 [Nitrospirae bacterium]|nr:hypothetical protein [Nitrospirota bacterium]